MTSEKRILAEGLLGVSAEPDVFAWRNNTGQAWQGTQRFVGIGQTVVFRPGMVILTEARPVSFGLPGSGDILGVAPGFGFALEAKTEDRRSQQSDQQRKFQAAFERAGGRYGVFRSPAEAVAHLRGWRA